MRGRKPKPTLYKELAGNPGHRPLNDREPVPPSDLPDCPEHLQDEARAEWFRICAALKAMDLHSYAENVLKGNIYDSSFFGYVSAADVDDDWCSPDVWKKANPSYGITIRTDQFEDDHREALQSPAKESAFRRYRLNQWVSHSDTWLGTAVWDMGKEPFDERLLQGRDCYLGIDLARKHDIGAVVLVFPIDEVYYLVPRFFLPSNCLVDRERHDHVSYSSWVQRGFLALTPGDVIDYAFIRQQVKDDGQRYKIQEIGYDPWNARAVVQPAALPGRRLPGS